MDELAKGLTLSLTGAPRDAALARFHAQIARWGLALPPVEPLVLDFGLGDFDRTGLIEYWIANEVAAGYCGKYLFVFAGQTCPKHHHRLKHETFFLLNGRIEVDYAGTIHVLRPGDVLPIATGKPHRFTGLEPSLLLELSMPCAIDDNYFENPAIPIGGNDRRH
ncbi:MAG: D-lyxose/D-mannose family sugar isomerase [Verrucomicrobiota bacterium]